VSTFAIKDDGDLEIPRVLVTDPGECARLQATQILNLWAGEWFLDQNVGFPWSSILGLKILNTAAIESLLKQAILSVTGVVSVVAQVNFNRVQRAFSYTFAATLNTGAILTGGSNQAFSVNANGN
jgi:hypothetical protein